MTVDTGIAERLIGVLRSGTGTPDLEYDRRPEPMRGGFWAELFAFSLAAGLTLIIGAADVTIALSKAALFGLSAGMIACYKGISVGGGPAGVGNAVNETVVFTFMALFAINVVATAVAVKVTL